MRYPSIQQYTIALTILSSLFCSGCIQQTQQDTMGEEEYSPSRYYTSFNTIDPDESKLPMESPQPPDEIKEELQILNQSGAWQRPTATTKKDAPQQQTKSISHFPIVHNKQVDAYIALIQGKQRRSFTRFLTRSGRYIKMIEKELVARGMPKELAYLALVESGFNPRARSYAKAVGLWQFMAGTGKDYHLKINRYIDERCNVEKSTKAAIQYLEDLYHDFDDWYLAIAAYNAGPGKIRSGMKKYKVDNFWDLAARKHLHLETIRYVPKLLATIAIAKNPAQFGFTDLQLDAPLEYDSLQIKSSLSLSAVALIADCKEKDIIQLNPELLRKITPPNQRYMVKIPKGKKDLAQSNMKRLHCVASTAYKKYRIKKRDTLSRICRRYNINAATLRRVNKLHSGKLVPGQLLRIPYSTVIYKLLPQGATAASLARSDDLILYKVKKGDTLGAIAKRYHIPVKLILSWNGLHNPKKIRAGQQLSLFIDHNGQKMLKDSSLTHLIAIKSKKRYTSEEQAAAAQPIRITPRRQKIVHIAQEESSPTAYYSVQQGDSLWTISRKFHISIAEIRQWNNLKSNILKPGRTLKIKKG